MEEEIIIEESEDLMEIEAELETEPTFETDTNVDIGKSLF